MSEKYKDFWKKFHEVMREDHSTFSFYENEDQKYGGLYWGKVNDDTYGFYKTPFIGVDLVGREKFIRVNVYIPNDIQLFESLKADKENIEKAFGDSLFWNSDCGKARRIEKHIRGLNYNDRRNYKELMKELILMINCFITAFESKLLPYRKNISEREKMSASLRFDVFVRDGNRCSICGRTAKDDNVKLHIDHIVPIANGGKSELSNLRVLCEECNLGKGIKSV